MPFIRFFFMSYCQPYLFVHLWITDTKKHSKDLLSKGGQGPETSQFLKSDVPNPIHPTAWLVKVLISMVFLFSWQPPSPPPIIKNCLSRIEGNVNCCMASPPVMRRGSHQNQNLSLSHTHCLVFKRSFGCFYCVPFMFISVILTGRLEFSPSLWPLDNSDLSRKIKAVKKASEESHPCSDHLWVLVLNAPRA